jgi:hypothetical protein
MKPAGCETGIGYCRLTEGNAAISGRHATMCEDFEA